MYRAAAAFGERAGGNRWVELGRMWARRCRAPPQIDLDGVGEPTTLSPFSQERSMWAGRRFVERRTSGFESKPTASRRGLDVGLHAHFACAICCPTRFWAPLGYVAPASAMAFVPVFFSV